MRLNNKKQILISISALILVLVMGVSFTYSWIEGGNKGYVNGNEIQINSDSSLTMIQDNKNVSSIVIPTCKLQEVSSADGKNFFFPMADNTSSTTKDMTFREGIPADVNTKYVTLDFDLVANDSAADVYLGSGTIIQCSNKDVTNALRMSFFTNDGTELKVFKPTQMPGVDMSYAPITSITEVGAPTTTTTHTDAYGDYYFKGEGSSTPLFELKKGETKKITLAIWLEGTVFEGNSIADTDLSIYIDFTTTVDDLIKYNFIDNCHSRGDAEKNNWVHNNIEDDGVEYETMVYIYDNSTHRYYALEKTSDTTWVGYIPKSVSNFYFRRYSIDIDEWWNEWEPTMVDIPTLSNTYNGVTIPERTFVAIAGQHDSEGENLDGCYGYWKDPSGTYRVYFKNEVGWMNLHCYGFDADGNAVESTGSWPGKHMTQVVDPGDLYYFDFKETDNVATIEFNGGDNYTTVYFGYNYDSHGTGTYAYVYNANDNTEVYSDAWPGTKMSKDPATGYYKITINTGNSGKFKVIVNNGQGTQFPVNTGSGYDGYQGDLGKSYLFKENYFELYNYKYQISDPQYFFNGFATWYKSPGSNGKWVYVRNTNSLIFPVNDPTPDTRYID